MNNNDILKRLRYAFDFSDKQSCKLFSLSSDSAVEMSPATFSAMLAKEEDSHYIECSDQQLAAFLDGFIVERRGAREPKPGAKPLPPVTRLSKNDVLNKLRIALNYKEEDMLATLKLGGTALSKSELSAFFRKPEHKHFRQCGNQVLRNFIKGVTLKQRPDTTS